MSELMPLNNLNALEVFQKDGLQPVLDKVAEEARSLVPDVSTEKGRKEIASIAFKVAKSKTYLDGLGKDLVSDWKGKAKVVDNERKRSREFLDDLKDEVRRPLSEWEHAEEERIQRHMDTIEETHNAGIHTLEQYLDLPLDAMIDRKGEIEAIDFSAFEEFAERMEEVKITALTKMNTAIEKRQKHEADQAELELLRKAAAEREAKEAADRAEKARKERDEQIRKEAAEKEKNAAKEREEALQEKAQAAHDAKSRAVEDARLAKERADLAEVVAKQNAEAEQARIKQQEADEIARRERNNKHKGKTHREIAEAIEKAANLSPATSKKVVTAMAKGEVPHVTINY